MSNDTKDLYKTLPGNTANMATVPEVLTEFIRPNKDAKTLLSTSKLVFIDRANTFQKKEEGNKKDMKRLKKLKRNDRPLTAREKRELKIYDIPKEAQRYDLFLPLAKLWQGYAARLASQGANFEQKLIKADLHGAMFNIIQSTNPTYVGVTGIMVQETLSLFKIITKQNKLKQIPKNAIIFTVHIDSSNKDFTLYGKQLVARPSDRAVKKFKPKPTINL